MTFFNCCSGTPGVTLPSLRTTTFDANASEVRSQSPPQQTNIGYTTVPRMENIPPITPVFPIENNDSHTGMVRLKQLPFGEFKSGTHVQIGWTERVSTSGELFTLYLASCCAFLLIGKDKENNPAILLCHAPGGGLCTDALDKPSSAGKVLNDELQHMSSINKAIYIFGDNGNAFFEAELCEETLNILLNKETENEKIRVETFMRERASTNQPFSLQFITKYDEAKSYNCLCTSNIYVRLNEDGHVDIETYHDYTVERAIQSNKPLLIIP